MHGAAQRIDLPVSVVKKDVVAWLARSWRLLVAIRFCFSGLGFRVWGQGLGSECRNSGESDGQEDFFKMNQMEAGVTCFGGRQNYGAFLDPYYNTAPNI